MAHGLMALLIELRLLHDLHVHIARQQLLPRIGLCALEQQLRPRGLVLGEVLGAVRRAMFRLLVLLCLPPLHTQLLGRRCRRPPALQLQFLQDAFLEEPQVDVPCEMMPPLCNQLSRVPCLAFLSLPLLLRFLIRQMLPCTDTLRVLLLHHLLLQPLPLQPLRFKIGSLLVHAIHSAVIEAALGVVALRDHMLLRLPQLRLGLPGVQPSV
mmetsp:Transcript_92676/g.266498  ORF Transcript_92676/g.266498 Transcript_92676/m.266498 type:complete len:210 (+) Transcript_92676:857-1486(+)